MAFLSIYRGIVADRKDPEKRGRLKLKVPLLMDDEVHDYWALPIAIFSSSGIGLNAIPEVGDPVWVQFEGGDIRYPIWSYGAWDKDKSLSSFYDSSGDPTKVALKTKSGQIVVIDDIEKTIELIQTDGNSVKLSKDGVSLISNKSVSAGSDVKSAQPAVLGDTNANVLDAICDVINTLVTSLQTDITASTGQPYLLYPTSTFSAVVQALVNLAQIRSDIELTKSNKVTLD